MSAPAAIPRMNLLLGTVFTLTVTEFMHSGMLSFGATAIQGYISATPEEYSIVTAMYAAIAIGAIAKMSWFIERLGWRRYVLLAVAFFITGSTIAALSTSFAQFVLGRIVMALGGAAFLTTARVAINLIPAGPARLKGIVAYAVGLSTGMASAPWVVAQLMEADHFAGIFALLIVLALLAGGLAIAALPNTPAPEEAHSRAHFGPVVAVAAGAFLVLFAFQRAQYDFYSSNTYLLAFVLVGVAALIWFALHQHSHHQPLLVISRLVRKRYLAALAVYTFGYILLGAHNTILPQLMQRGLGYSWHTAGLVQALGLAVSLPVFFMMMRIVKSHPAPQKFYATACVALGGYGWLLSGLTPEANIWRHVVPAIALFGSVVVLLLATSAIHGFTDFREDEVAFMHAQQVKNMLSQFGTAFGVIATTLVQQWRTAEHNAVLSTRFVSGDEVLGSTMNQLANAFSASQGAQAPQVALGQLLQSLGQQAALLAELEHFRALVYVAIVMGPILFWQRAITLPAAPPAQR